MGLVDEKTESQKSRDLVPLNSTHFTYTVEQICTVWVLVYTIDILILYVVAQYGECVKDILYDILLFTNYIKVKVR
jgi:hypothetical protein